MYVGIGAFVSEQDSYRGSLGILVVQGFPASSVFWVWVSGAKALSGQ